jgi:hypothetical protein
MKRDLDLCRELMMAFEEAPPGHPVQQLALPTDHDAVTVLAHIDLLIKAELLEGYCRPIPGNPSGGMFLVKAVTWAGHDFIASAKSEKVWNVAKDRVKKAGSWTFGLLLEVLKDEAKRQLGSFLP